MNQESQISSKTQERFINQRIQTLTKLTFTPSKLKIPLNEYYYIQNGMLSTNTDINRRNLTKSYILGMLVSIIMLVCYFQFDRSQSQYCSQLLYCALLSRLIELTKLGQIYKHRNHRRNNTSVIFQIAFSLLWIFVAPNPWFEQYYLDILVNHTQIENHQIKINYVLVLFGIFSGIVSVIWGLVDLSKAAGPRAKRAYKLKRLLHQKIIILRYIFKQSPILMFGSVYGAGLFCFSFALKVCEGTLPIQDNPFSDYFNCVWFIFVTQTTVGYSDLEIRSSFSRLIMSVSIVWGTINISAIITFLVNFLSLSTKQAQTLHIYNRIQSSLSYKKICQQFLWLSVPRIWRNKKYKTNIKQSKRQKQLRFSIKNWYASRKQSKDCSLYENMDRQFSNVKIDIDYLHSNNTQLLDFLNTQMFTKKIQKRRYSILVQDVDH